MILLLIWQFIERMQALTLTWLINIPLLLQGCKLVFVGQQIPDFILCNSRVSFRWHLHVSAETDLEQAVATGCTCKWQYRGIMQSKAAKSLWRSFYCDQWGKSGLVRKLCAINHSKPRWRSLSPCPPDRTTSLVVIRGGFGSWGRLRTVTLKMRSRGKLSHFPTCWSQGAVKPWGHAWKGMVVPWAHTRPGWRGSRGAGGSVRQRWYGWAAGCAPRQPQLNPSLAKDARDPRRRTSKVVGNFSLK